MSEPTKDQKIWQVVAAIPRGCVASYGQVAAMAGLGRQARYIGRALGKLPAGHFSSIAGTFIVRTKEGGNPQLALDMMLALMYGMIPSANTERFESAPPENMLK